MMQECKTQSQGTEFANVYVEKGID